MLSAESKIAVPTKESLAPMLDQTGLVVEEWLGNWRGEPYAPTSPKIIPIGRLRQPGRCFALSVFPFLDVTD
ncbi:hypothetical protein [Mesorhizobium sp.]|uniref:hypothetical protein n=1 Tax=Mesorhizobium sp. TaxID=1871066 RepID=UPI000FE3A084|nr:hypothetical protein [Mesorhizobium sp.]RWO00629.1 MAG: hypothetical protein EOS06_12060 [Mesorhizobium sp.]RWO28133.1 MAG: hypothetical protein EOS09_04860 [Mesorhizobium sp.]RWO53381.1 MAG: hypothetical protein EOS13_11635 [Mesorhizobium sp.]TIN24624.1 MAG: hypothetical protein E5Y19_21965 [Mesorhizobium sp.]TIN42444.1 MAG: hypothetical protein E5Y13_01150 [Mesorhizobium sp.]